MGEGGLRARSVPGVLCCLPDLSRWRNRLLAMGGPVLSGDDPELMKAVLRLAARARSTASPNPMVGALVVRNGQVVGSGWHRRPGTPHAEVNALRQAGSMARGATVYVNLEPCAHQGRTPPCTGALIDAGVARVVAATGDPDPRNAGRGLHDLREAGIEVSIGLMEAQARRLNEAYLHHRLNSRPFVTYKAASSLDGRSAAADGSARWITSEQARADAHRLRRDSDAICAGIGTVLSDDPQLTVRHVRLPRPADRPLRVVVDSLARTPVGAQVLSADAPTLIATALECDDARVTPLTHAGVEVLSVRGSDGRVALPELLERLGSRGIVSMLLEGGATLAGRFAAERLIDKFVFYLAPKLLGESPHGLLTGWAAPSIAEATGLKEVTIRRVGPDLRVTAYPVYA
ncbi:MAG: bifunctional diaminohydroxyphosphoribosylaminopyrimidine deaminase/5-amino-6-(5-phosphoribosylamino)uracil reductase RibD [Actinomycetota bacterium]